MPTSKYLYGCNLEDYLNVTYDFPVGWMYSHHQHISGEDSYRGALCHPGSDSCIVLLRSGYV